MSSALVLALLIALSFLPLLAVYAWQRRLRPTLLERNLFLLYLAAGLFSLLTALILQALLSALTGRIDTSSQKGALLWHLFIQTALTEEASRALVFAAVFALSLRRRQPGSPGEAAFAGLVAGLSFAALETAYFSLSNMNIALLRAFTAGPLHGACAARVSQAVYALTAKSREATPAPAPPLSAALFASAVITHGLYDFLISGRGLYTLLAITLALTAFFRLFRLFKEPEAA